jgi:hypothetical protein
MTGLRPALIAVSALLAAAPAVSAKEISKVTVCGDDGDCASVTAREIGRGGLDELAAITAEGPPPEKAAPWYRIKITMAYHDGEGTGHNSWTVAYVPSEGMIRGQGDGGRPVWGLAVPESRRILSKLTAGVEPLPASRLTGLHVTPPAAQVSEVFSPARPAEPTDGSALRYAFFLAAFTLIFAVTLRTLPARSRAVMRTRTTRPRVPARRRRARP